MTSVRRSLAYSIASSYFSLPLQIIGTMIISRLLTPAETGVFAVAAVFATLASTFRDFGVAEYLIQEKDLQADNIRAAFTVNIAVSWSMALLLFGCAPVVASFYRTPGVADVMHVQALNFVLIPFGAVTMAYFRRELNFRPIFIAGVFSSLISLTLSIVLALRGFGYMTLAWSSFAGIVVTVSTSLWFRPRDFPRWPGIRGIRRVLRFGTFASGIYVFGQIGKGAPEMIIGRAQDLVGVAMFSRAYGLVELFNRSVLNAIVPVCLPYFARGERDQGSVNGGYLKSIAYLTAIGWPFLAFTSVVAYAAIRIVYGNQWLEAVPLAPILCLAGAIELIHHLAKEALIATNNVKRSNALQIAIQSTRVLGLLAVIPFGLRGACFGLLAAAVAIAALSQWSLNNGIALHLRDVIRTCLPSAAITALSVTPIAAWTLIEPVNEASYLRFTFIGGPLAMAIWLVALRLTSHPLWREISAITSMLRARLRLS